MTGRFLRSISRIAIEFGNLAAQRLLYTLEAMGNHLDFARILEQCSDPAVGAAVLDAINRLFERDRQLLVLDAAERAVASRIAHYLAPYFEAFSVDVDYNRMGDSPKTVAYDEKPERVYPDVIVHVRGDNRANVLAIELKKDTNRETKDRDIRTLRAYRRELEYRHALFLRFGTGESAGAVLECEWVDAYGRASIGTGILRSLVRRQGILRRTWSRNAGGGTAGIRTTASASSKRGSLKWRRRSRIADAR